MAANEDLPSVSEIASAAVELIKAQTSSDEGIYLSRLGGMLSAHFRRPTREILGNRKLSQILVDGLGSAIQIEGSGATLAAKLISESELTGTILRFDPVVWAAFAKPISPGALRYFKVSRPFTFVNELAKVDWTDPREIREGDIADRSLPKAEREREITQKIDDWCARNGVHPSDFKYEALPGHPRKVQAQTNDLLRRLVEAIPAEKRKDFSLPFDLLYELLGK